MSTDERTREIGEPDGEYDARMLHLYCRRVAFLLGSLRMEQEKTFRTRVKPVSEEEFYANLERINQKYGPKGFRDAQIAEGYQLPHNDPF